MTIYAEPVAATNFSFLRGASPGPNLVMTALLLGQTGLGIADRADVAAALILFRLIYFVVPLVFALILLSFVEWRHRHEADGSGNGTD